ncbi:IS110 family transposase [Spirulina sp. 06S082]|uniref:IS110 family transposase n=1 Tax=Spirulina sp. 06S082 TaxID=3110248 RepID=UPI002B20C333|nr:transposase [Spirulina sp. 06S082]MEA5472143.1 transposase [Spirulina sp. 06S082]
MVTNVTALGADVCKDRIVCWLLHEAPSSPRDYYRANKRRISKHDPLTFFGDSEGISNLIDLLKSQQNPALVLEPSGIHYAKLFAIICQKERIPILWVGHDKVKQLRKLESIKDKTDQLDAFLLALYALRYRNNKDAFVRFEPGAIARIREMSLQLKALNRIKSPSENRLKQQLAHEFPEVALREIKPSETDGLPPLYAWIAGIERADHTSGDTTYNNLRSRSIATQYDIEISQFSRHLAKNVCDCSLQEWEMLKELYELLQREEFQPYLEVFERFNFGIKTVAVVLGQVYPFENYSSLELFKSRLGLGMVENSSGVSEKSKRERSSKHTRTGLVLWVFSAICCKHRSKPKGPEFKKVCDFYDRRLKEFQDNPLQLEYREGQRYLDQQRNFIKSLRRKGADDMIINQMELSLQILEKRIDGLVAENKSLKGIVKGIRDRKGYKVLLQNQTAARAAQYLYWALKARLKS